MSAQPNPLAWLGWAGAAALVIVATRNPLYLLLAGAALGTVYLSLDRPSGTRAAWRIILRIGGVVALLSVLFNLLTVHSGDRVFARLPASIPIVGGPLTLNALVYGLTSALALLDLLLVAAVFSAAVDRAALLRLVPAPLAPAGLAAIVALSVFPQTLQALREVRDAQAARGFQVRGARDLPPLLVPVLHLGIEHALDLAETMECRAFASSVAARPIDRRLAAPALLVGTAAVVSFALGHGPLAAALLAAALAALAAALAASRGAPRGRYHPLTWGVPDLLLLASAGLSAALTVATLITSHALVFSPYPRLLWPEFAAAPGVAGLLLVCPALVAAGWDRR